MILFGEASLRRTLRQYVAHYHRERTHQGAGNRFLQTLATVSSIDEAIQCRERLGKMLNYYYVKQLDSTRSIYVTTRHYIDRGSQYLSNRYTQRLTEVEHEPSVGRPGDSYDNALADTIIDLFKTEDSIAADHGSTSTRSNTRRSSGSTGTTLDGCSLQSATCRHWKRNWCTIVNTASWS